VRRDDRRKKEVVEKAIIESRKQPASRVTNIDPGSIHRETIPVDCPPTRRSVPPETGLWGGGAEKTHTTFPVKRGERVGAGVGGGTGVRREKETSSNRSGIVSSTGGKALYRTVEGFIAVISTSRETRKKHGGRPSSERKDRNTSGEMGRIPLLLSL